MLKDITLGQYFPGKSLIHRLDPRFKIIITLVYIVMLFVASEFVSILPAVAFTVFILLASTIPLKLILRSLKPIVPIIIITSIFNIFLYDGNTVLSLGIFEITDKGIKITVLMALRIVLLIAGTSLLTYTTSPIMLTDGLEQLLSPLKKIKVPVHDLAMMMTIALRFIPTLIEETDKIVSAQKARGADLETGSVIQRAKALVPVFIPLIVSAVRRAEELALAMECRCYRGEEGRTRLRTLKTTGNDILAIFISLLFLAAVVALQIIAKK